jgi:hypothetical protein
MGWTGRVRASKLSDMKTEDLLAYERERLSMSLIFAQAAIELVLPLAVVRARQAAPWPEAEAAARGAPDSGSCESAVLRRLC